MSQPTLYISHTDFRTRLQKQAVSIQMDDWATIAEFYRLGTAGEIRRKRSSSNTAGAASPGSSG